MAHNGGDSMNPTTNRSDADQKTLSRRLKIKTRQLNDVVQHLVRDYYTTNRPIENRISADSLYTIISQELNKKGINLPFQFGVVMGKNDSLSKVRSNSFSPNMIPTAYKATLFPNDVVTSAYYLVLVFQQHQAICISIHVVDLDAIGDVLDAYRSHVCTNGICDCATEENCRN